MSGPGSILRGLCLGLAFAAGVVHAADPARGAAELRFLREGHEVARLALSDLRRGCASERIEVEDPYYATTKAFFALPTACVLALGFGALPEPGSNLFLRAADGYTRPTGTDTLRGDDTWLAFSDAQLSESPDADPVWAPIDRRQVHPGPFYLIWRGPDQNDPHRYPWPYQLVTLELAPLESEYHHMAPGTAADTAAGRGFDLFRAQCIACHAINGDGGRVGPDLNVPQSIVEYRPEAQIRAYIRDPEQFRFTSMPSHRHLSEDDLDALVAYFQAMAKRKHLPRMDP